MGVDDLYHILFTHWVYDSNTYHDEHQRVQVATGLLLAVYTGCRPVSLFDTSERKFDNGGTESNTTDNKGTESSDADNNSATDSTLEPSDTESFEEFEFDRDSNDGMSIYSGTTESICYNDVQLPLLHNDISGGPPILAATVTLIHTKGAKRRSESLL